MVVERGDETATETRAIPLVPQRVTIHNLDEFFGPTHLFVIQIKLIQFYLLVATCADDEYNCDKKAID